jgi:hypothetical protein
MVIQRLVDNETVRPWLLREDLVAAPKLTPPTHGSAEDNDISIEDIEDAGGATIRPIPLAKIVALRPGTGDADGGSVDSDLTESIRKVGLIEPLLVEAVPGDAPAYQLLRGHRRVAVLKGLGWEEAASFVVERGATYLATNSSRGLNALQEHVMVRRSLDCGVNASLIATALKLDHVSVWRKRRLLRGICGEAAHTLSAGWATQSAYETVRKVSVPRQRLIARLFAATQNYSRAYGIVLLAATSTEDFVKPTPTKRLQGLGANDIRRIEQFGPGLEQMFLEASECYGQKRLEVVAMKSYLRAILEHPRLPEPISEICGDVEEQLSASHTLSCR